MYRSPCCNVKIPWWQGLSSDAADPIECPNCGKRYHDNEKRKYSWLFYLLFGISIGTLVFVFTFKINYLVHIGIFALLVLTAVHIVDEYLVLKKGVLTETTHQEHKKSKLRIKIGFTLLLIFIAYEIIQAL